MNIDDEKLINSRQVREMFGGVSEMWLWRRLHDDSGFPKPTRPMPKT